MTLSCLAGVALVGFILLQILFQQPGPSRHNFERINEGATLKDVEGLLGPGVRISGRGATSVKESGMVCVWYDEPLIISVWFDKYGKVEEKNLRLSTTKVESLWVKLCRRLGL
jgi:hypothetical protein